MKVNELRVDNLILFKLHGEGNGKIGQMKRGDFGRFNNEEYHPIPLTPEWLERCGFEYLPFAKDISLFSFYKRSEFELIIVNEGIVCEYEQGVFYYSNERRPVKYVHQLQNLFFALIGEELNVKL